MKKLLSEKNMFITSFWNIEQFISGFLPKSFRELCESAILPLHSKTLGKISFSETFTVFHQSWSLRKFVPAIPGYFYRGWQNWIIRDQRTLGWTVFARERSFNSSLDAHQVFFGLQQKSNKNLSKPLEECLYERFNDKQFFSDQ